MKQEKSTLNVLFYLKLDKVKKCIDSDKSELVGNRN